MIQQLAAPFNKVFQHIQHFASKMLDKAGQQHARVATLMKVFRTLARVVIPKLIRHDEVKTFRNETRIWAFTCKYYSRLCLFYFPCPSLPLNLVAVGKKNMAGIEKSERTIVRNSTYV